MLVEQFNQELQNIQSLQKKVDKATAETKKIDISKKSVSKEDLLYLQKQVQKLNLYVAQVKSEINEIVKRVNQLSKKM